MIRMIRILCVEIVPATLGFKKIANSCRQHKNQESQSTGHRV